MIDINLLLLLSIIFIYALLQKSNETISRKELLFIIAINIFGIVIPILSYNLKPLNKFNIVLSDNSRKAINKFIPILLLTILILLSNVYQKLGKYYSIDVNIKNQHKLITTGIYGIIRHPTYLGALLYLITQQLYIPNKIGIVSSCVAMAALLFIRIPKEEKLLEKTFGDEYINYKFHTNKIIPYLY